MVDSGKHQSELIPFLRRKQSLLRDDRRLISGSGRTFENVANGRFRSSRFSAASCVVGA